MSDAAPTSSPASQPNSAQPNALETVRVQLDTIDDQIHDLLMRRADIIDDIRKAKGHNAKIALRPGREAQIIRRLLARHRGELPRQAMVRLWRELLAGTTAMQGNVTVAVCETDANAGFTQIAREHFGALTPLRAHRSPAQALADLSAGTAATAVLPLPSEADGPREAWWTALMQRDDPRVYVIARLPFWTPRPDGTPRVQALALGVSAPDASGQDRSFIGLECGTDVSRNRLAGLLETAGLKPVSVVLRRDAGAPVALALVEVDGMLGDDDPRLARLDPALRRPVVLGGYALGVGE